MHANLSSQQDSVLTLRNFPTSSRMSLKTNTFLSPSNQPCFVIRAMSCEGGREEVEEEEEGWRGGGVERVVKATSIKQWIESHICYKQ